MTVMQSCDHHDEHGLVPDARSRARMLQQLRAATALSEALSDLFGGVAYATALRDGRDVPIAHVDVEASMPLMLAWLDWLRVSPSGDDWAPAHEPPAEVRVAPEGAGEP